MSKTATAKPSRTARKFGTYDSLRKIAEQPMAKRKELPIGRGGASIQPRKFHLSDEEIEALKAEYKETKRFPNPQNRGNYYYIIEALVDLGLNEAHPQSQVFRRMEKLMSAEETKNGSGETAWERFTGKEPRNEDTGKDVDGRIEQNILVMQRLTGRTPYGLKLFEVGTKVLGTKGAVIDVLVGERGARSLRLNTRSDTPINEAKVRGAGSPAALEAAKAAAREARKAAPKAKKATKRVKKAASAPAESETVTEPVTEAVTA